MRQRHMQPNRSWRSHVLAYLLATIVAILAFSTSADAQVAPVTPPDQTVPGTTPQTSAPTSANTAATNSPSGPQGPVGAQGPNGSGTNATISLNLGEALAKPSESITIIVLLTLLSIAPSMLIMTTSFTRIVIVLALTRNAIGIPSVPPNQVMIGLAVFLTFFVMSPTFSAMYNEGIQPMVTGKVAQKDGFIAATKPLKTFMLKQTRSEELALFVDVSRTKPDKPENVSLTALVPAFIISELKTAFIIGFIVFIPFLVIDIIVSSSLMAMGMMMLPPQMISLPFKLLLFVLVDGWSLLAKSLLTSFN